MNAPTQTETPTGRRTQAGAAPAGDFGPSASERLRERLPADEPSAGSADEALDQAVDVAEVLGKIKQQVDATARERPYLTVAAAAGVGYVLGGGLPSFVVRGAVQVATKAAVSAAVAGIAGSVPPAD